MTKRLENNIMIMMCCPQVLREAAALMGEGDGMCSSPRARTMHYYNSATRTDMHRSACMVHTDASHCGPCARVELCTGAVLEHD